MIFKLLLLVFSISVFSFDKDFQTVNDRVPLEFQTLFSSMKLEAKTPVEKVQLVGIAKELDDHLANLPKEHLFMFLKSEVIKNTLEYKFSKVRNLDVTTDLVERLEREFKKKSPYLNPYATWIWRSIIAELNHRRELGLITNKNFSPGNFQGGKLAEAQRFEKYLKYLKPWIDRMDSLPASDFNTLTKEVGWTVLRRVNLRSLLYKKYASTAAGETRTPLFNIPAKLLEINPEDIRKIQTEKLLPPSLREQGAQEKDEASRDLEKATPTDMSPLSEELDKLQ